MLYLSFFFLFLQVTSFADDSPDEPESIPSSPPVSSKYNNESTTNTGLSPITSIIGDGGKGSGHQPMGDDFSFDDYGAARREDIEINQEWFYSNSGVPAILKDILRANADQETISRHANDLHIGCKTYMNSGLEDFITSSISPLFTEKPGFCSVFSGKQRGEETISRMQYTPPDEEEEGGSDDSFDFEREEITRSYHDWPLDSEKLNPDQFTDPLDKFVINQISQAQGEENPPIRVYEQSDDDTAKGLYGITDSPSTPPKELISAGLLRLWGTLSQLEQMQLLRNCPRELGLNTLRGFWNISSADQRGSSSNYQLGLRLCQADKLEDVIPLLDKSLLSEYMLNLSVTSPFDTKKILDLCEAWPAARLTTSPLFPPAASVDQLFFNIGEHYRNEMSFSSDALSLFNPLELENLTDDQREAIEAYTSSNYDAMNAYQMWGSLGLFFLQRYRDSEEEKYSEEDLAEMDQEFRREILRERDVFRTMHGRRTATAVRTLREALRGMDQYNGVSFSAQKLSGHFFTSLRVGSTFTPDFFMSTSIDQDVAISFLDLDSSNTEERYLFVVNNRTGVPLTNHSSFSEEQEVLVHPDASFEVVAVEPFIHNGVAQENIKVVYLSENP
jgi:hypothetical protein